MAMGLRVTTGDVSSLPSLRSSLLTASMMKEEEEGDRSTSSGSADGSSSDFFSDERRCSEGADQNTKGELGKVVKNVTQALAPPNHSGIEISTSCRGILSVSDLIDKELLSGVHNDVDEPGTSESLPRQRSDMALTRAAVGDAIAAPAPPRNSSLRFARRRCYSSAYGADDFFEQTETRNDDVDERWL